MFQSLGKPFWDLQTFNGHNRDFISTQENQEDS